MDSCVGRKGGLCQTILFLCPIKSDETLTLKEHVSMKRSKVEDLDKIDWAGADIPVAKALKERGI